MTPLYIDPATTSYIIQVVSGLAITLSVAIGVFFRKIQLFFVTAKASISALLVRLFTSRGRAAHATSVAAKKRRLSTANKSRPHSSTVMRTKTAATQPSQSKIAFLFSDSRKLRTRLGLAALVSFSVAMAFALYPPLDLYSANASELPFTLSDLLPSTLIAFFAAGIIAAVILTLFRGRVFDVLLSGVIGLATCGWLQYNFLNPDFGTIMGNTIQWQDYTKATLIGLVVWTAVLGMIILIRIVSKKAWTVLVILLSTLILAGSAVSLVTSMSSAPAKPSASAPVGYLSWSNAFTVSSTANEIVFLVDMMDANYVAQIRDQDPTFFAPLDGFTNYPQNMTSYSQTDPGVPSLLTDADLLSPVHYEDGTTYQTYKHAAWEHSYGLKALHSAGWSINIFSSEFNIFGSSDDMLGLVDNFAVARTEVNRRAVAQGMYKMSAFVTVPVALKPSFWMDSTEFHNVQIPESGAPAPYYFDDDHYHRLLDQHGLSIGQDKPQFSFIHLEGSHMPYTMNAEGYRAPSETDPVTQTKGVFTIIFDYVDQMKKLGVYDNSTIVILADHGTHLSIPTRVLDHPILGGLLVKPRNAHGPLQTSLAPVSQDNFMPTLLEQAGVPIGPLGLAYDQVALDSRQPRYFTWLRPTFENDPAFGARYKVSGDAREWSNWTLDDKYPLGG